MMLGWCQLGHLHVQGRPVLPLQAADFNGDQLQDIIVMTYDAIYGWAQVMMLPAVHGLGSAWGGAPLKYG